MKVNPYANNAQGTQSAQSSNRAADSAKARRTRDVSDSQDVKKASDAAAGASGPATSDISVRAREMSLAKKVATDAPDVREERIAELKRRIANKEYNVAPEDIAERMVGEHMRGSGLG